MAEKLRIPSTWLVFLVFHIVQVICTIVEHFGDDEGAFPGRSKLVWTLLVHSENQVSLLKFSTSDVSSVETTQVLLIDGRPDHGNFSFLFQKINHILPGLLCFCL